MLLNVHNLKCHYGEKLLLDDVSFSIEKGDKIGLIGVNGTGKSTLLSIIAFQKDPESGDCEKIGNVKISYMPQEFVIDENQTIMQFISKVIDNNEIALHEAKSILTKLEINDFEKKICELSGGTKRKLSLGAALSKPCDLLILDEPTNHLDCEIIEWLEKYLIKLNKAILLVTHDRYFLEKVVNRIIELDHGKIYEYEANYSRYLELKAEREDYNRAAMRKINSFLRKEYEWIKRGPQARATKDKKRIEKYEELSNIKTIQDKKIEIDSSYSRLGNKTIEFINVSYDYEKPLFENVSFNLNKDARIGLIGKNGAGKSTFLNLICGDIHPTKGTIEVGQTIKFGYFRQENIELNPNIRAIDYINDIASVVRTKNGTISSTQMLENFLFDPYVYIKKLSGGEKRRLILLGVLMKSPNVLLFDEPTNDLDITTLTILEDYLLSFEGIVIIASHDRFLLDKTVDTIFEINDGKFNMYNGNYSNYLEITENIKETKIKNKVEKRESSPKKVKLTFKEEKEYSTILDEINDLESQLDRINNEINIHYSDYEKCKNLMEQKKIIETHLEEKMLRWEYLSEKADV